MSGMTTARRVAVRCRQSLMVVVAAIVVAALMAACEREPFLNLHDDSEQDRLNVQVSLPIVDLDLRVYWAYDTDYDWQAEWTYGWDNIDLSLFGEMGYTAPTSFDLRSYYLGNQPGEKHTDVDEDEVEGTTFQRRYNFGYYDLLVWNQVVSTDEVQSLLIDEATTLDSVMVTTNMGNTATRYDEPSYTRAFYQPEELFAAYEPDFYVSPYVEDYDYYDEETQIYHKMASTVLTPVTYIYLTQVRLHNNNGRIYGVDGEANLSGMAKGVTLNSGIASSEAITVHFNTRFKRECIIPATGESVDVAGGRCLTFGITSQCSSRVTRDEEVSDATHHYMDVNFVFNNGMDSTLVFDVTDQVRKRYKGGVITVDLDVDSIQMPDRAGGSGFNAVVRDYEEVNYEFGL